MFFTLEMKFDYKQPGTTPGICYVPNHTKHGSWIAQCKVLPGKHRNVMTRCFAVRSTDPAAYQLARQKALEARRQMERIRDE